MIDIIQRPGDINGAFGLNMITVSGIDQPEQRYRVEIWNEDDTILYASLIITPNQFGNGIVDIQKVLQTLVLTPDILTPKTTSTKNTELETNLYNIKARIVNLLDEPINNEVAEEGPFLITGARKDQWKLNFEFNQNTALTDMEYRLNAQTIRTPKPADLSNPFTTKVRIISMTKNDFFTLTYLNDFEEYKIYPFIGNIEQTTITKVNVPSNQYPDYFIYLGLGPKNLGFQLPSGTTNYWINVKGDWTLINIIECTDFEPIELMWLNSYGFLDYYVFTKRFDKTLNVSRNTYNKSLIDYNFVGGQVEYGVGGETVYSQTSQSEYVVRTDYLDDQESVFFENLVQSPKVYARIGTKIFEVILTSDQWRLQRFITDKMFQFETSFKIAVNKNMQRG